MPSGKPIVVVLSGGQDSTTCLFLTRRTYPDRPIHAVTFDYGQRHAREIDAAKDVARLAGVSHEIVALPETTLRGTSPLTDKAAPLETYASFQEMTQIIGDRIEKTFVPLRNLLFLTLAANRAAVAGADRVVLGICEGDTANYPDCRQSFLLATSFAINLALGNDREDRALHHLEFQAPLLSLTKADTVRLAWETPGAAYALAFSHTAYTGTFPPGEDHASVLRAQGFLEAGLPDPLILRAWLEELIADLPPSSNYVPVHSMFVEEYGQSPRDLSVDTQRDGILRFLLGSLGAAMDLGAGR